MKTFGAILLIFGGLWCLGGLYTCYKFIRVSEIHGETFTAAGFLGSFLIYIFPALILMSLGMLIRKRQK